MSDGQRWTDADLAKHLAKLDGAKQKIVATAPPRKYRNQPTLITFQTGELVRGTLQICHTFDSGREAKRYQELHLLALAGGITDLELQPAYDLTVNDKIIGQYVGDFRYMKDGGFVLEDVKGMAGLPLYRWKVKHLKAQYAIEVVEIR